MSSMVDFIEKIAQERLRYETIFGEQAEILRTDQHKFDRAMAKIQKSPLVAKHGQRWEPTQENVDKYLATCDDMCHVTPHNFDDRVKIMFAAHAALMCLVFCKIGKQPDWVQLATIKRHNELALSIHPTTHPIISNCEAPPSKPLVEPRNITNEELQLFQNPDHLHGKQFLLSPNSGDSELFKVIGYSKKWDKMVTYDVLFDDCEDPIMVNEKEMMGMLGDSLYFPVSK
ncbi:hypothetical protein BJY52DRAFT_1289528 [Lactarius psammicola]|nr:hypothetical protein BJY52DRAFT_1289528 [Lactarius psammicola]